MDTGTLHTHPMLSGQILDSFSSCFGSFPVTGSLVSICPGAVANTPGSWDTPFVPGSATPPPLTSAYCTARTASTSFCDHGSQVASAAAGKSSPHNGRILSGVAPAAKIVPFQVFSWNLSIGGGPGLYASDLFSALNTVLSQTGPSPADNFIVVNMSIGSPGTYYATSCGSGGAPFQLPFDPVAVLNAQFASVINVLKNRGVPVVAAAGNNAQQNAVEWPACLPGVVKVGSVLNPTNPADLSIFLGANLLHIESTPSFAGDFFFLAPGGGGLADTQVTSATVNPTNSYRADFGTSLAAPHVAGAYAVVRAGYAKLGLNAIYSWQGASQFLKQDLTGVDLVGPPIPGQPAPQYRFIRFDAVTP